MKLPANYLPSYSLHYWQPRQGNRTASFSTRKARAEFRAKVEDMGAKCFTLTSALVRKSA